MSQSMESAVSMNANTVMNERKATLGLLYDYEEWEKTPFIVALPDPTKPGQVFPSYEAMLVYTCDPQFRGDTKATQELSQIAQEISSKKYLRLNPRNTSLGGNEAINCYPQFNEDDDIIHLATASHVLQEDDANPIIMAGLGRVYSEVYDTNQKVMYISAGVAKYSGIFNFYENAIDPGAASLIHGTEKANDFAKRFGTALGSIITLPVTLMVLPFRYLNAAISYLKGDTIVSKYYDFWSDMVLYYKHVNDILIHLTVNLGLTEGGIFNEGDQQATGKTGSGVQIIQRTLSKAEAESRRADDARMQEWEVPFFLKNGVDMFKIATRRETFLGNAKARYEATQAEGDTQTAFTEKLGNVSSAGDGGIFSAFGNFLGIVAQTSWTVATGGDRYLGFRVEKSTDTSESFSNSTGESSIAGTLNSAVSSARETMFSGQGGETGTGSGILGFAGSAIAGAATTAASTVKGAVEALSGSLIGSGSASFANNMICGNAYIDIPEVWTGSQFSKSYSFRMQLRDPHGGNPISFIYNIGVPLACMLALALPRSAGTNSYGQPFFIRAYCKGMFAVPLGIIDSMTVTRGAAEHGWSIYGLPTVVEISFSVKDLATVMHMALNDTTIATLANPMKLMFGANSPFQEYLLTLSSMGLKERLLGIPRLKRRMRILQQSFLKNTIMNPYFTGAVIGNGAIMQIYGIVSKYSTLPE